LPIPAPPIRRPTAPGPEPFRLLEAFDGIAPHQYSALEAAFPALPWRCGNPSPVPQGDTELVIIRGGLVAVMCPTARGRRVAAALLEPGDVYPFRHGRSALVPIADAWLSAVPSRRLVVLMERAPRLGVQIVRGLASLLEEAASAAGVLCEMRVEDRLMGLFRRLAMRHGVVTQQGVRLTLELSHSQWGTLVGASREGVTAALLRLRRRGTVVCQGRTVLLPDLAALRASATAGVLVGAA
jgi:CRP/FNR family transcriptional regulator